MFDWIKKQDWRLVKTLDVPVKFDGKDGQIYYHLFESNKGTRKVNIQCSFVLPSYMDLKKEAKTTTLYQTKIYRWEMGRVDPDIPRYNQVPQEETANVLKGKIS